MHARARTKTKNATKIIQFIHYIHIDDGRLDSQVRMACDASAKIMRTRSLGKALAAP